jgi:hypothetical protein
VAIIYLVGVVAGSGVWILGLARPLDSFGGLARLFIAFTDVFFTSISSLSFAFLFQLAIFSSSHFVSSISAYRASSLGSFHSTFIALTWRNSSIKGLHRRLGHSPGKSAEWLGGGAAVVPGGHGGGKLACKEGGEGADAEKGRRILACEEERRGCDTVKGR